MLDLGEIREKIDGIDKQLVSLFEERMALCHSVAEYKISTGKKVLDTERENAKLAAITKMVQNPENVHAINDLFSQIMANSRKMQYRLLEENGQTLREPYEAVDEVDKTNCKVVYQGVPGAYSYIAMKRYFGENVENFTSIIRIALIQGLSFSTSSCSLLPSASKDSPTPATNDRTSSICGDATVSK